MRPRIAIFLAAALGLLVSMHSTSAQDKQPESSPLEVTAQFSPGLGADCVGGEDITLQLHYVGARPLRGYLVELDLTDAVTGGFFLEKNIQEIRNLSESMITSDGEWTRTFCSPVPETYDGHPVTITPKVDVLKFEDGSNWGPAALSASHRLIGTFDGMDFVGKETSQLERFVSPILPEHGPLPVEDIQSQTIGPLKIDSGVWRDERGRDMLAVNVTNVSDNPVRGYLLTTTFFDAATGDRIRRVSTKQLETHGNPSDYLAPGATWVADPRKFSYLPDGTLATYKINLDLVVFADGSTFGPKKSAESQEVMGMFRGIDAANLLNKKSSPAQEQ
jgi:hypothetical protein